MLAERRHRSRDNESETLLSALSRPKGEKHPHIAVVPVKRLFADLSARRKTRPTLQHPSIRIDSNSAECFRFNEVEDCVVQYDTRSILDSSYL